MGTSGAITSVGYFVLAGLCEIGGGYLVWLWLREEKPAWYALLGAFVLLLYAIVPTFQPAHFGRVYAAYGGVFIVLSILWGLQVDRIEPDRFDILGGYRGPARGDDHHVLAASLLSVVLPRGRSQLLRRPSLSH